MVEVIGAGLPRTGTSSMKAALERLGYAPCYHMFEFLSHPEHMSRWTHAVYDEIVDWDRVLQGYRAGVDWPASFFWRELAAAYPQAKVVLNDRDPHSWYRSLSATMFAFVPMLRGDADEQPPEGPIDMAAMVPLIRVLWTSLFGQCDRVPDEQETVAAFRRHRAAVVEAVPAERLLVYELGQGWGPLCAFLGAEEPDTAFPHLNDTEAMHGVVADIAAGREVTPPFP